MRESLSKKGYPKEVIEIAERNMRLERWLLALTGAVIILGIIVITLILAPSDQSMKPAEQFINIQDAPAAPQACAALAGEQKERCLSQALAALEVATKGKVDRASSQHYDYGMNVVMIAAIKGDPLICDRLGEDRQFCIESIPYHKIMMGAGMSECDILPDSVKVMNCYSFAMDRQGKKEDLQSAVYSGRDKAAKGGQPTDCSILPTPRIQSVCADYAYSIAGFDNKDSGLCDKVSDQQMRESCKKTIDTGNPAFYA